MSEDKGTPTYPLHSNIEKIASICHAINRAYCKMCGDITLVPWDQTPEIIKESVRSGVRFALDHPEATPETMHEEWMKYKLAEGWTWGPVKDIEKKKHPNIVSYYALDNEQQTKDHLFLAVVRAW